ncbi:DUF7535 family protein [Halobacterium litoreum]|uniref:Flagellin N-terminal-like domain-containing protein n=1 Tax=Halobacterium litoreum TaxID=2039234 RepID=A0ABD5NFB1_9EURY|nr:hypothetical protein [Halobacterium litoreum]UHH13154.1 hypothetical protein LT972_13480 [Halobacterium litoreum]
MSVAPEPAKRVLRTVTPPYRSRPDAEMTTVGWMVFLGLLAVLVPLLPFVLVVWLISKVADFVSGQVGGE